MKTKTDHRRHNILINIALKNIDFIFKCACVYVCVYMYVHVCVCVYECRCPCRSEEGIRSPGAGVLGCCEPLSVSAGNQTQVSAREEGFLNH